MSRSSAKLNRRRTSVMAPVVYIGPGIGDRGNCVSLTAHHRAGAHNVAADFMAYAGTEASFQNWAVPGALLPRSCCCWHP